MNKSPDLAMHALLENAVQSVQVGVEDYLAKDPRRVISATRNISAGILLLFKEKLRRLSPPGSNEVLVKQQVRPAFDEVGQVNFVGFGRKTVDVNEIRERFSHLGISVNWKKFNAVVSLRNEVEHYYTGESASRLKELLTDAVVVMRDFVKTELKLDPANLFGDETWSALLTVEEIYAKEEQDCEAAKAEINWNFESIKELSEHLRCSNCQSALLKPLNSSEEDFPSMRLRCAHCGHESTFGDLAEDAIDDRYGGDMYYAATRGGESPIENCSACGNLTFIVDDGVCASCGAGMQRK